jgi:hypothetical protein
MRDSMSMTTVRQDLGRVGAPTWLAYHDPVAERNSGGWGAGGTHFTNDPKSGKRGIIFIDLL